MRQLTGPFLCINLPLAAFTPQEDGAVAAIIQQAAVKRTSAPWT
jgi:hypothetical protein